MEVKDLSTLSLFPLCLHTDPDTSYSYISNPTLTKAREKFFLKCRSHGPKERVQTFYAVIPAYVPVPPEMLVFAAENSDTNPKFTISVRPERDPNVVNLDDRVSFIAWSRIIPYTVPLYLYRQGEFVYPSFSEKPPPSFGPSERPPEQELVSPIWVVPEKVSINGKEIPGHELGFECYHDARCILSPTGTTLLNCLNHCTEVVPPENIFHYINRVFLSKKVRKERPDGPARASGRKILTKLPNWALSVILAIFFILLVVLISATLTRGGSPKK